MLLLLPPLMHRVGPGNMCIVHVSLVPIIGVVGEQKTKPTQHSVAVLRSLGLHPNLLACRCSVPLDDGVRQKLALFCQVPPASVLTMHDVSNIWRVPLLMQSQDAHATILSTLGLGHCAGRLDMHAWKTQIADRCVWHGRHWLQQQQPYSNPDALRRLFMSE